ncbi:nucleotidyltransferase family protein [Candidatus Gottesmanbacteria bacterium]|nr:nucleotidyltransferase family protein [Candidatus Gottesmanbacteria bacterium]
MNRNQLDEIKNKAVPILEHAGVTRSAIFGSYVRGEDRKDSDIDILVEVPKGTGLFAFVSLKNKLEKELNKKVDLLTYKSIHPSLRKRILKEQLLLNLLKNE